VFEPERHPKALGKELIVKKIAVLLSVGLIASAFVIPASPVKANPFAGVASCTIDLPEWPTDGDNTSGPTCDGIAVGINVSPPTTCATCEFHAKVDVYNETCVPPLPPLIGSATGEITSPVTSSFSWTRVGLVAVLTLPGNTQGVAAFVPHPPLGTCGASAPLTADVVGIALAP
jgi:hypothetical protein